MGKGDNVIKSFNDLRGRRIISVKRIDAETIEMVLTDGDDDTGYKTFEINSEYEVSINYKREFQVTKIEIELISLIS